MSVSYYFFGDTSQRGLYNEEKGEIQYKNSGVLFVRDQYSQFSDKVISNQTFISERDEYLPLKLFNFIGATINDEEVREYLQSNKVKSVYRLQSKELTSLS